MVEQATPVLPLPQLDFPAAQMLASGSSITKGRWHRQHGRGSRMIGRTVGNYRVVEKLGEGGMGTVFRAVDQLVERNVAIKVLKPDLAANPEIYERFLAEARALAK